MSKVLLHTPEGVRDIYNEEIEKREVIINQLQKLIKTYGYDKIQTPTFEYMSVFYKDISLRKSKELYKFFDSDGDTLVLRPDFTPSIARAASKYFKDERSVRLFYAGNVFVNSKRYQGRLKESCQFGGELIGEASIDGDAEIISLVINSLKSCNLCDFQISIGHSNIFKGLVESSKFDDDEIEEASEYMINRNVFGLEEFLEKKDVSSDLKELFVAVCKMYTPETTEWTNLLELSKNYSVVYEALCYLNDLYEILKVYDVERYISFETGSISNFDYYTGIIFSGYTYGSGEPIVSGGRYDNLLSNFGKTKEAIGFAILVDQLQLALDRQNILVSEKKEKEIIVFSENCREKAINKARELRSKGAICEIILASDVNKVATLYKDDNVTIMED